MIIATEDIIKIIGKIVVRIESEGWISEGAELFITGEEVRKRDIIGKNLLPSLEIEERQMRISRVVSDSARGPQEQRQIEYSPIQRNYIKCILGK